MNKMHLEAVKRGAQDRFVNFEHALLEVSRELLVAQQDASHAMAGAAQAEEETKIAHALLRTAKKRWRHLEAKSVVLQWRVQALETVRVRQCRAKIIQACQEKAARAALQQWGQQTARLQRLRRAAAHVAARSCRHIQCWGWTGLRDRQGRLGQMRRVAAKVECKQARLLLASALSGWHADCCCRHLAAGGIARLAQAAMKRRQSKGIPSLPPCLPSQLHTWNLLMRPHQQERPHLIQVGIESMMVRDTEKRNLRVNTRMQPLFGSPWP